MKTISVTQFRDLLVREPQTVVLDVRTAPEFASGHVKEAELVPLDRLDPQALLRSGRLAPDRPVYLLCRSGARAAKAGEKIAAEGAGDPIVVEGGTLAWIEAGLHVERSASKIIPLERQVRIAAGSLVLAGFLLGWFSHPYFFLLSGFVGAGLIFAGITDWCGMGLLLAKAPWNK